MKKFLTLTLALLLVLAMAVPVSAGEANVTYNGDARKFIFQPGSKYSPTDLFPDLKDVMPGDSLHQRISIVNDSAHGVKIRVYMRAIGAHTDSKEFLSQMKLTVNQMPDAVIYEAPAHETAQLSEWVSLGQVYSGGSVELDVRLDVPTSMDNSFQEMVGYLDWEFAVEELPISPEDPEPPKTGDDMNVALYVAVLAVAAVLILVLLLLGRKKKKEEDQKDVAE